MDHVLPLLIERAAALRNQQAAAAKQAQLYAGQAGVTLGRLEHFRVDCLARSPAGMLASTWADTLVGYQHFVTRLDEAIVQQTRETELRHARASEQQAMLAECERRLLAFQKLQQRRAADRNAREQRQLQRDADEFAARAARRTAEP